MKQERQVYLGTRRRKYSASKLFSTREANYNGHKMLAAKIIEVAIRHWRRYGHMEEYPTAIRPKVTKTEFTQTTYNAMSYGKQLGFKGPKEELLCFFYGDWFETLCDVLDLHPADVRRKMGIGV